MDQAITPRLERRDEKLNQQLLPLFDPSRRLFFSSGDPKPVDQQAATQQFDCDMKYGVLTVNEVRSGRGLPPVPWGDIAWLPVRNAPADVERLPSSTGLADEAQNDRGN